MRRGVAADQTRICKGVASCRVITPRSGTAKAGDAFSTVMVITTAARAQCIRQHAFTEEMGLLNKCNRLDLTPNGPTDRQSQAIERTPGNARKEYGLSTAHADQALGRVPIIANGLNHTLNTILNGALIILCKGEADIAGQKYEFGLAVQLAGRHPAPRPLLDQNEFGLGDLLNGDPRPCPRS